MIYNAIAIIIGLLSGWAAVVCLLEVAFSRNNTLIFWVLSFAIPLLVGLALFKGVSLWSHQSIRWLPYIIITLAYIGGIILTFSYFRGT